jgi:Cu+-exporting ATPase
MRLLLFVLLAGAAGCSRAPAPAQPVEVVIPVEGMTCGGCEQTIQEGVGKLPGVSRVRASHKEKRAWVSYDAARVQPARIVEEIVRLGYRAQLPAPPR